MLPVLFKPQTNLWTSSKIQFGRTDQLKTNLMCLLLVSGTCLAACFLWFSTGVTKLHKIFFSWYWQAHDLKRVFRLAATWSWCLCHVHCLCRLHVRGFCNDLPPEDKPFPITSSFKKSGGKQQWLEMEKKWRNMLFQGQKLKI